MIHTNVVHTVQEVLFQAWVGRVGQLCGQDTKLRVIDVNTDIILVSFLKTTSITAHHHASQMSIAHKFSMLLKRRATGA
jgi:hypothetical protein